MRLLRVVVPILCGAGGGGRKGAILHFSSNGGDDASKLCDRLLEDLKGLVGKLQGTCKKSEKIALVNQYPQLGEFLHFFVELGPLHLSSASIIKAYDRLQEQDIKDAPRYESLQLLLGDLNARKISGNRALATTIRFIRMHEKHKGLLLSIFDRKLHVHMGRVMMRKALLPSDANQHEESHQMIDRIVGQSADSPTKDLSNIDEGARHVTLPRRDKFSPPPSKELSLALGYPITHPRVPKYFHASLEAGQRWFVSRKLDGIRCLAKWEGKDPDRIQLLTRTGNQLSHLPNLALEAQLLASAIVECDAEWQSGFLLDGELCVLGGERAKDRNEDDTKSDDFRAALSIVLRRPREGRKVDYEQLTFFIFDLVPITSHHSNISQWCLSKRLDLLEAAFKTVSLQRIRLLPQFPLCEAAHMTDYIARARQYQWEGLMVRRDGQFVKGRSRDLIKFKDFYEAEFPVLDYRLEPMQILEEGRQKEEVLLSSLRIAYRNCDVWVGSGLSLEERRRYARDPSLLRSAHVSVRYFRESHNSKDSTVSLRFPTIKAIYEGGRTL